MKNSLLNAAAIEYKRLKIDELKPKVRCSLFKGDPNTESDISPMKIIDSPPKSNELYNKQESTVTDKFINKEILVNQPQSSNINLTLPSTPQTNLPSTSKIVVLKNVKLSKHVVTQIVKISPKELKKLFTPPSLMQKQNLSVLSQIPTKDISPGKIYPCQAIKVGNTVQLVPIKSYINDNQKI